MADASVRYAAARTLIDHEHKHERDAIEMQIAYGRDGVDWFCTKCGAEGFVDGVAIVALRARLDTHA